MEIYLIPVRENYADKGDLPQYVPNIYYRKIESFPPWVPDRNNVSPFFGNFMDQGFGCEARDSESEENYFLEYQHI